MQAIQRHETPSQTITEAREIALQKCNVKSV